MSNSAALPLAWVTLRVLIVINWIVGAAILALLLVSFQQQAWLWQALGVADIARQPGGAAGMRAIIAVGVVSAPVNYLILRELARIVETVRAREPFSLANAQRLRTIAWALLVLEVLGIFVSAIGSSISTAETPLKLGGTSVAGWLAVVLLFVLSGVFREGAAMRADLEGTI